MAYYDIAFCHSITWNPARLPLANRCRIQLLRWMGLSHFTCYKILQIGRE